MFGSVAERRFKQFRALFAVHDPMLPIPNRRLVPNNKVDHLLLHMLQSSKDAGHQDQVLLVMNKMHISKDGIQTSNTLLLKRKATVS